MELSLPSTDDSEDSDLEILEQLSDWDTSDSSDDEAVQQRTPSRKVIRINYMQTLDDAEFTFRFRLPKSLVNWLLIKLTPVIPVTSSRNHGLPPLHQILVTLRFYALGTMLVSVADFVGVSVSTAGRIVRDISGVIANLYDDFIKVHQQSAVKFYRIGGFPRVLGAIDCTHIRIQSPCNIIGEEYRNRKGYLSFNVQAICDADLRFMNVEANWPGSKHKATIFNNSVIRGQCDAGKFGNRWLLGDSAYPNRPYLLTPILNPSTEAEQLYNEAHSKTRNTIQRAFAVWKCRFPIIALSLRLSLPKVQTVIIATAVLHNICIDNNIEDVPPEMEIPTEDIIEDDNNEEQDDSERTTLVNSFFSEIVT